jgi:hypothetical protein
VSRLRFVSNWEILFGLLRHPLVNWRHRHEGNRILNGFWFKNPYSRRSA